MCGLIGELRWPGLAQPHSLAPLRHRGPDAEGTWISRDRHCWLGHTRLAIQDLSSAGNQPITSECGRFTLVFNGEIYNHLHLRSGLSQSNWRGHSDSETLVEGLAQRGLAFIDDLRGMFAFAAYDSQLQQLWLVRDDSGIKPLYLLWQDGALLFASERRALVAKPRLLPQEISQFLAWGHLSSPAYAPSFAPASPTSLPPGARIRIQLQRPFSLEQVWASPPDSARRYELRPAPHLGVPHTRRLIRRTLEQAVEDHLLSDVPVACFLSSGMDSGILAALAMRCRPESFSCYTVAFPGLPGDEGELASSMARHCGSTHQKVALSESEIERWMEEGLQALDLPTADGLNTYLISRAVAGQGVKVAFSGLGADELFGGYPSHRLVPWLLAARRLPEPWRLMALKTLSPRLADKLQDLPHWDPWHLTLALRRWVSDSDLQAAGAPPLAWPVPPPRQPSTAWGQISCGELHGYTEPMLLRDSDVLTMANGLELRVPFLDQRLVAAVMGLPSSLQIPGKRLLRDSFADLFPKGYLDRPKQGFALPMSSWMRTVLAPLCRSRLEVLVASGWLDPRWLRQQWQAFERGHINWPRAWSLVVLGEFAAREAP